MCDIERPVLFAFARETTDSKRKHVVAGRAARERRGAPSPQLVHADCREAAVQRRLAPFGCATADEARLLRVGSAECMTSLASKIAFLPLLLPGRPRRRRSDDRRDIQSRAMAAPSRETRLLSTATFL